MVTSQADIASAIERFIQKQFRIVDAVPDLRATHLFESGLVDSAGVVELISFVESTFKIRLGDDEVFSDDFTTINGIASIVETLSARRIAC
jgi:acyl carrier protein